MDSIRPLTLNNFIGQDNVINNLKVFIQASLQRDECLDHLLLVGLPGLGKTTLANIIAFELGRNIKITSGMAIEKPGDLVRILTSLEVGDVVFIDEIHSISSSICEILYSAMEDFYIDLVSGERSVRITLPPFTLIGATTKIGYLPKPLRDRFLINCDLRLYDDNDISLIVKRSFNILDCEISDELCLYFAKRCRGTPRIVNKLVKRVRDYVTLSGGSVITLDILKNAFVNLGIDDNGLDTFDYNLLKCIANCFDGGPVGINSIAAYLGVDISSVELVCEPYLLQCGFLKRTSRGRIITDNGYKILEVEKVV